MKARETIFALVVGLVETSSAGQVVPHKLKFGYYVCISQFFVVVKARPFFQVLIFFNC